MYYGGGIHSSFSHKLEYLIEIFDEPNEKAFVDILFEDVFISYVPKTVKISCTPPVEVVFNWKLDFQKCFEFFIARL